MLERPNKVPWFVVLAIAVAGVAMWEQQAVRKQQRSDVKALREARLPPPAPQLEALGPQRGATFAPGAPIEHTWSPLPGVQTYQLDFAVPQPDGGCSFDPARPIAATHATLRHDDPAPCMVWRVRAAGSYAGGSYTVGPAPGCTLPPGAMVLCLESGPH